jgi:hypothetical protein
MTRAAYAAAAGSNTMSSTAREQGARRGAIRGGSPHVAVQHHGYFHCYIAVFLRHTMVIVGYDCAVHDEIADAGLTRAPNDNEHRARQ